MVDARWANDPNVAPYVWEAKVNGVLAWVEYPEAYPQVRFADIGFTFRKRTGLIPGDVHTYVNDTPMAVLFTARSLRTTMPNIDIEIAPADALVWTHRGAMSTRANVAMRGGLGMIRREGMLFGRERPSGELSLMQVFPDGSFREFRTYHAAMSVPL